MHGCVSNSLVEFRVGGCRAVSAGQGQGLAPLLCYHHVFSLSLPPHPPTHVTSPPVSQVFLFPEGLFIGCRVTCSGEKPGMEDSVPFRLFLLGCFLYCFQHVGKLCGLQLVCTCAHARAHTQREEKGKHSGPYVLLQQASPVELPEERGGGGGAAKPLLLSPASKQAEEPETKSLLC